MKAAWLRLFHDQVAGAVHQAADLIVEAHAVQLRGRLGDISQAIFRGQVDGIHGAIDFDDHGVNAAEPV